MRVGIVALIFGLLSPLANGQAQSKGGPTAVGQCAVSHTGNGDIINITNCGIGREQGNKIVQLLRNVAAKKDLLEINAKLDELVEAAKKPAMQIQNCTGSGPCFQGTQVFNGVAKPLPHVLIARTDQLKAEPPPVPPPLPDPKMPGYRDQLIQRSRIMGMKALNPGVKVVFTVDAPFVNPMFAIWCDRPCSPENLLFTNGQIPSSGGWNGGEQFLTTGNPDIWITQFGTQNTITQGLFEEVSVRSLDALPINIVKVEPYVP